MFYSQQLFRTAQAAQYLGFSKSTLEKRRYNRCFPPCFKLSNIFYYDKTELDAWLLQNNL
jgi:predicted DNA-binding transcriptional regulator AlpA